MSQIIEGTWEEIAARAEELRGKKLRVTVLEITNQPETEAEKQARLQQALKPLLGTIDNLPPDLSERAEEYFAQIMDEKYPRKSP